MLDQLRKFDHRMATSVQVVCAVLLAALVITVSIAVFTRFVIFYPLNFADPLAKYLMMWTAFLGVGLAFREREHIAVNMFVDMLGLKAKRAVAAFVNCVTSVFLVAIIYYGALNAWSGRHSSDPLVFDISMLIPYLSVPVGALYAVIQLNLTTCIQLMEHEEVDSMKGGV